MRTFSSLFFLALFVNEPSCVKRPDPPQEEVREKDKLQKANDDVVYYLESTTHEDPCYDGADPREESIKEKDHNAHTSIHLNDGFIMHFHLFLFLIMLFFSAFFCSSTI